MKSIGIIPARYASTRLPGKPLISIAGKPMVQHVYERSLKAVNDLYVATDDERIVQAVKNFKGKVISTAATHNSGTNRCLEAYEILKKRGSTADVIVNIQGDEPLIEPTEIENLICLFSNYNTDFATLAKAIETQTELENKTGCFVVLNKRKEALYFSRALIPVVRNYPKKDWLKHHTFYKHLGMYAYRPDALKEFAALPQSKLEQAESLEQNRWLENGGTIHVGLAKADALSVDTPEDLAAVKAIMEKQ
jgi:3-deoxy-manno-octulosonate cytidylyltransferase (CMP-KDO synthetase)